MHSLPYSIRYDFVEELLCPTSGEERRRALHDVLTAYPSDTDRTVGYFCQRAAKGKGSAASHRIAK